MDYPVASTYLTYRDIGTTVFRMMTYDKNTIREMTVAPVSLLRSSPRVPGTKPSHGK